MSEQKKCAGCLQPFTEEDVRAKVQTRAGPVEVHRYCVLIMEHSEAADVIEVLGAGQARYQIVAEQSRRRAQFYRDHNAAVLKEQQNASAEDGQHEQENIVEAAAIRCGYVGRTREWASEVLLREAQRVVYGDPAIRQDDWERQAMQWHDRASRLRDYIAGKFSEALQLRKPKQAAVERAKRVHQLVEQIERGEEPEASEDGRIVIARGMPKLKH